MNMTFLTNKGQPDKFVSRCKPLFYPHFFQPKLTINQPNDVYEQEADAMADRVMRMTDNGSMPRTFFKPAITPVQRKCAHCEEEENKLQRKETNEQKTPVESSLENYIGSLSSGGQPLPNEVSNFYEPRFGYDFSGIKVHTDTPAARSAQSVNALAYTSGSNIVFNSGQYSPETDSGKRLLGHELTHVVQQNNKIQTKTIQRLGVNTGCNGTQRTAIHQAIFDARGWINNALAKVSTNPADPRIIASLARNFGPTYGVSANLSMIVDRVRRVFRALATMAIECDPGTHAFCVAGNCGFSVAGSLVSTICPATVTAGGNYLIGCVLHEAFHAVFSRFTVDEYSGWHGAAVGTPAYPGAGVDPLLNADSYTTFVIDLS